MRVLVVGATGFIGARVAAALADAGHEVIRGHRQARGPYTLAVDFTRDESPADWAARLRGIDVVINAVGILREAGAQTFAAIHDRGPVALFAGCALAGVGKVVQVSALGAAAGAPSAYHRSKAAADRALSALPLRWVVVRPSLVFGAGGASGTLFCALATLPVVPLPDDGDQQLQPLHVDDLVGALVRIAECPAWDRTTLRAVGPAPVTLRNLLASLRSQLGLGHARFLAIPAAAVRAAAWLGRWRPGALLDPDTLGMLMRGNVAPPADIAHVLGHAARPVGRLVQPFEATTFATAGRLAWLVPLLRVAVALLWIVSGVVSLGAYPVAESHALLARAGVGPALAPGVLWAAASLDILLGVAVLALRSRHWLWRLQLLVIAAYSAIIAVALPEFWLHPFAPMVKNVPLAAAILLLHELDTDG